MSMTMHKRTVNETIDMIEMFGTHVTIIGRGDVGVGKSSMLFELSKRFPTHTPCMFDCTTKTVGDLSFPRFRQDGDIEYITHVPSDQLGLHLGTPVIVCIDEFGKGANDIKLGTADFILNHKLGSHKLPEGSIVFATTNKGTEGLGDMFQGHTINRLCFVEIVKPDAKEWLTKFAIPNGVHSTVMSVVKDHQHMFQSFEDVVNPDDNPMIFHPQRVGDAQFLTHRGMKKVSDLLYIADEQIAEGEDETYVNHLLKAAVCGQIGVVGGELVMNYRELEGDLPSLDEIKSNPASVELPKKAATQCMDVMRVLALSQADVNEFRGWLEEHVTYFLRLPQHIQFFFAVQIDQAPSDLEKSNGKPKTGSEDLHKAVTKRKQYLLNNDKYAQWALDNADAFAADDFHQRGQ